MARTLLAPLALGAILAVAASASALVVAVGDGGEIHTSPDGVEWSPQHGPGTDRLRGVATNGHAWIAVGEGRTILFSADGKAWVREPDLLANPFASTRSGEIAFRAVATNGTFWVVVGDSGLIFTSPDAFTWTPRPSFTPYALESVSAGADRWMAVGAGGTVLTSLDGATWTPETSGTTFELRSVATDGKKWLTVGTLGTMLTSLDGVTWAAEPPVVADSFITVAHSNGTWAASVTTGVFLLSADGVHWLPPVPVPVRSEMMPQVLAFAFDGKRWMAVGQGGMLLTSTDALTWTAGPWLGSNNQNAVASSPPPVSIARSTAVDAPLTPPDLPSDPPQNATQPSPALGKDPPSAQATAGAMRADASSFSGNEIMPHARTNPAAGKPQVSRIPPATPDQATIPCSQDPLPSGLYAWPDTCPTPRLSVPAPRRHLVASPQRATSSAAPLPALPVTVAAAVVAVLAALAFRLRGQAAGGLYLLFTRLRQSRLLDHPIRAQIFAVVREQPGIHFREIVRLVDREIGVVSHHLQVLVHANLVLRHAVGGRVMHFPTELRDPVQVRAVAALRHPSARQVMEWVSSHPGATIASVAQGVGMRYVATSKNLKKLQRAGLARAQRESNLLRHFPTELAADLAGAGHPFQAGPADALAGLPKAAAPSGPPD